MPPELPQPNLSPEERKTLKEARAFIESIKPGQTFTMPKEYLEAFIKAGEGRPIPLEQPKPEKTRRTNELSPLLESILSKTESLNHSVFGNLYDSLFPESIPVPNFSPETLEFIEKGELFPYYSPEIDFVDLTKLASSMSPELILTKDTNLDIYYSKLASLFPNWQLPNKTLFELAQKYIATQGQEGISPESLKLSNQWLFIETVQKPNYNDGKQRYPETELMSQVGDLMKQSNPTFGSELKQGNRFALQWPEITGIKVNDKGITELDPNTKQPIHTNQGVADYAEKVLNAKVSLPTNLLWNLLANMLIHSQNKEANQPIHKPDKTTGLGSTNTYEWDSDERYFSDGKVFRLLSGYSDDGGLSYVYNLHSLHRHAHIGFRLFGNG